MLDFSEFSTWSFMFLFAALLGSLLFANLLKKIIPALKKSLIPSSVLGGLVLLIIAEVFRLITKRDLFNETVFGGNGYKVLEIVTYHCLALGFIASSFKTSENKMNKKRAREIFNSGVTTVSTYILQGVFGLAITIVAALVIPGFFKASGIILPFGYGQGTGQAMNYGSMYQQDYGFTGGTNFGLTIAALGFLSASIGGVIHLNILRRRGKVKGASDLAEKLSGDDVQRPNEIPMQESVDKLTVQIAYIALAYILSYFMMFGLSKLLPGMTNTIFGFNFLIGVLSAVLIKSVLNFFNRKKIFKRTQLNNFLMTRIGNVFYDIMVVSGIAAIRLSLLQDYWGIVLILGAVGLVITYIYNRIVAKTLFPEYKEEQFLAMYGMLTGTASTGIILLREIDSEFKTPASDNLVFQTLPAIVFGFPIMLLATLAPLQPELTLGILVAFFIVMNIILFRNKIFRKKSKLSDSI